MRTLIINLLATALLLVGASSASALGLQMELNPGSVPEGNIQASDLVIVDIYLDAGPGLGFLAVALLWDDNGTLTYQPGSSTMPTYILYAPGVGTASPTYLIPNASPPNYWNGNNVPGPNGGPGRQILVEYLEPSFGSATATGSHIWIATVVFHVTGATTVGLDLTLNANGTIVEAYANDVAGSYTTTGSFTFVPEPTTALLIGFGLVGLTMAGRRRD